MSNYWIFSNKSVGSYGNDFDTSAILKHNRYYFVQEGERNRSKVNKGDKILLREYGSGFWGECDILKDWQPDPQGEKKFSIKTGWFPISKITKWKATLPYEVIRTELSNQNYRLRIAKANAEDYEKIQLARRIYKNLGYGATDGELFLLENGIEEAVKANLPQLGLKLAGEDIQQQCNLGIGVGRSDLICRDAQGNFVVLELKAVQSSDYVVGQILRYMGYIRENWAKAEKKDVKGIILTPGFDEQLRLSAKEAEIKVLRIRIG